MVENNEKIDIGKKNFFVDDLNDVSSETNRTL